MPSGQDEKERRRLFVTSKRLLKDIDGLIARMRGRWMADNALLATLRRLNEERIALERDLWVREDRILREILACPTAYDGSPANAGVASSHALTPALFSMRQGSRSASS